MPADNIRIVEVAPRDGLQNEATPLDLAQRLQLIQRLIAAGLRDVEVGAFVRADRVPQMAGTDELMRMLAENGIVPTPELRLWVLVPNAKGLQRALAVGASDIAIFVAASEAFSQANTQCSIRESMQRVATIMEEAAQETLRFRGYISCVWGCPYGEEVQPAATVALAQELLDLGIDEISLGDTIGVATPDGVHAVLDACAAAGIDLARLAVHFHDTKGRALANVRAALARGVRVVDAAVGGIGGCPFARPPGTAGTAANAEIAAGNVATESILAQAEAMGQATGVDRLLVATTGRWALRTLGENRARNDNTDSS